MSKLNYPVHLIHVARLLLNPILMDDEQASVGFTKKDSCNNIP